MANWNLLKRWSEGHEHHNRTVDLLWKIYTSSIYISSKEIRYLVSLDKINWLSITLSIRLDIKFLLLHYSNWTLQRKWITAAKIINQDLLWNNIASYFKRDFHCSDILQTKLQCSRWLHDIVIFVRMGVKYWVIFCQH